MNPILKIAQAARHFDLEFESTPDPISHKEMKVTYKKYDEIALIDVPIRGMIDLARRTASLAVMECQRPAPGANASQVEYQLGQAMLLVAAIRVLEDHAYDWNVTDSRTTLQSLTHMFQEATRYSATRYDRAYRTPRGDVLANVARRFQDDLQHLRVLESGVRARLAKPFEVDFDYDILRPDFLVSACFSAALELESHYEERAFGPR